MVELLSCGREKSISKVFVVFCVYVVLFGFCLLGVGRFIVLWLLFVAGFFSLEDNIPYCAI